MEKGEYFKEQLNQLKTNYPIIKKVKGLGLMVGCELYVENGSAIVQYAIEHGVLINIVGNKP